MLLKSAVTIIDLTYSSMFCIVVNLQVQHQIRKDVFMFEADLTLLWIVFMEESIASNILSACQNGTRF